MSVNEKLFDVREVQLLKDDLCSMNEVYREIADEIGVENALAIYNMFRGTQVSFPSRLFSKEYIHRKIQGEYDGYNVSQLAQKYNYSERNIRRILKSKCN